MTAENISESFKVEEIVAAEYEYIAQTAFQAQEDRARVTTFYLVSIGSLFGAFFGTKLDAKTATLTYVAFAGLFLFLSYFGLITLKQLIRLRKAWFESAKTMNQIKDFLITQNKDLEKAFRWKSATLPNMYKPTSVAYLLAQQVAMLGAITSGAMIFYTSLALSTKADISQSTDKVALIINPYFFVASIFGGFLFYLYQMNVYKKELNT